MKMLPPSCWDSTVEGNADLQPWMPSEDLLSASGSSASLCHGHSTDSWGPHPWVAAAPTNSQSIDSDTPVYIKAERETWKKTFGWIYSRKSRLLTPAIQKSWFFGVFGQPDSVLLRKLIFQILPLLPPDIYVDPQLTLTIAHGEELLQNTSKDCRPPKPWEGHGEFHPRSTCSSATLQINNMETELRTWSQVYLAWEKK